MSVREVSVSRVVAAPAGVVWDLVTDVRHHARWVPLTRIDGPDRPVRAGDEFTGVTGPTAASGGRGVPDVMVVERYDPPAPAHGRDAAREGVATFRKRGPVLMGDAEVRVRPLGSRHSEVTWVERTWLRGLPRPVGAALTAVAMSGMLHLVLRRVAAEVSRVP
ncbi:MULTISPECIES: SRPBCC family protein [unclassified Actinotalea]|uniref:SRPBCC family protein n=1 Tax=unclassified Actinotalea TaxID=2638618 RepID=UPI0015F745B9|nr:MULTISPECIES: SRPBCC family protein [unclassified Actinotalea]